MGYQVVTYWVTIRFLAFYHSKKAKQRNNLVGYQMVFGNSLSYHLMNKNDNNNHLLCGKIAKQYPIDRRKISSHWDQKWVTKYGKKTNYRDEKYKHTTLHKID